MHWHEERKFLGTASDEMDMVKSTILTMIANCLPACVEYVDQSKKFVVSRVSCITPNQFKCIQALRC
jgi:hypothetical protein